jgi:alpha-1,6-mannosyltransferase
MASGTPVVARAADGLAELVDDSVGASVPSRSPRAFADAIAAVCAASPTEAGRRRDVARARAESYDWNRIFPALFERYAKLLSSPR